MQFFGICNCKVSDKTNYSFNIWKISFSNENMNEIFNNLEKYILFSSEWLEIITNKLIVNSVFIINICK